MNDTLVKLFDWTLEVAASFIPCAVHFLISIGTRTSFNLINFETDLCFMLIMYCSNSLGTDEFWRRKNRIIRIYKKILVGTLGFASVLYGLILLVQDVEVTSIFVEDYIVPLIIVSIGVLVAGAVIKLGEG